METEVLVSFWPYTSTTTYECIVRLYAGACAHVWPDGWAGFASLLAGLLAELLAFNACMIVYLGEEQLAG